MSEEKSARQKADFLTQEKERQISMLSVDYRQIQQRLQKLEGEHRQEVEKVCYYFVFVIYENIKLLKFVQLILNTFAYYFRVKLYMLKSNKN